MASRMGSILIIGATAGIGEAFTRRFHSLGKTVIATGRNQDKLNAMAKELPGLQTRQVRYPFPSPQHVVIIHRWEAHS